MKMIAKLFFLIAVFAFLQKATASSVVIDDVTWHYAVTNDYVVITNCSTSLTNIAIPSYIEELPVRELATEAFGYFGECHVTIPATITNLNPRAFGYSSCWVDVAEDHEQYVVEDGVVYNKDKTKLVFVPLMKVDWSVGTFNIPAGVKIIGEAAFYTCANLKSIEIGGDVEILEDESFYWCCNLSVLKIQRPVKYIGNRVFHQCCGIKTLRLANSVKHIGNEAFWGLIWDFKRVQLPDSLRTIGTNVFGGCSFLNTILVPYSAKYDVDSLLSDNEAVIQYYETRTESGVPFYWVDEDETLAAMLTECKGDYELLLVKKAANGVNTIGDCYIAGLDPHAATAAFRVKLEMVEGKPCIRWEPNLNEEGAAPERVYTILGREALGTDEAWEKADLDKHRFFKVKVSLPE